MTGTTAALSMLGADDGGEANLIYDWSVVSTPDGADGPTFSDNDTNTAQAATATFYQAGTYTLRATIANAAGLAVSQTFDVTLTAALASIAIAPPPAEVPFDGHASFSATVLDQFGNPLATQPAATDITWGSTNGGFSGAMYTAPGSGDSDTVTASYSGFSDSADVALGGYQISATGAATYRDDMPYMLTLASAGVDDHPITSWHIDWGDGTGTQTITGLTLPGVVPHVFTGEDSHTITVTGYNSLTSYEATVSVAWDGSGVPLPLSGDATVAAGDTYTLTFGDDQTDLGSGAVLAYTVNWGDGTSDPPVTADDLAAEGDQVTHVFASAPASPITVDLSLTGDSNSPYTSVGTQSVSVDTSVATTTTLSITNSPASFGDKADLQAVVAPQAAGEPTGTVEFFDQIGSGSIIDLGPGTLNPSTGVATFTTQPLIAGSHSFTAVYGGDDTFTASTSSAASASITNYPVGSLTMTGGTTATEGNTTTPYALTLPTMPAATRSTPG